MTPPSRTLMCYLEVQLEQPELCGLVSGLCPVRQYAQSVAQAYSLGVLIHRHGRSAVELQERRKFESVIARRVICWGEQWTFSTYGIFSRYVRNVIFPAPLNVVA